MCLRTCIQRQLCVHVSSVARLCMQRAVFRIVSLCPNLNFFEILSESNRGIFVLSFSRPTYRYDQAQVGKSSASEIGVLWVALRDIVWNLRCHHRGTKVHEIVTYYSNIIQFFVLPLPRPIYWWDQAQVGKSSASKTIVLWVSVRFHLRVWKFMKL